jgi:ribosomal protein S18 acetylase RimI-like enzyme
MMSAKSVECLDAPGQDSLSEIALRPYMQRLELHRQEWDSEFFGTPMGVIALVPGITSPRHGWQVEGLRQRLSSLLDQARTQGYAHVIFRVGPDEQAAIWAAESAGMRLVDIGVDSTFDLGRGAVPELPPGAVIRPARSEDLPALRNLAGAAFVLSRFGADPFFRSEQVVELHRQWITNLYHGLAQAVLVCELDQGLAGFVSCALSGDQGRIPLIATRADFRRRGAGRALVAAALQWFSAAGARAAHVKTQAHNYPALALYHRAGFVVSKTELTFSITLAHRQD